MSLRMLVGLDASPRASEVLEAAIGLAERMGGKLILSRTVGVPHEIPREAYALPPDQLADMLVGESKRALDAVGATAPAGMIEKTRVDIGTPWQVLCSAAKEDNVDMVIIGSHGYQGLDRVIGTTAAKVVNHCDRSVLVIRMKNLLAH